MKGLETMVNTLAEVGKRLFLELPYLFAKNMLSFNSFFVVAIFFKVFQIKGIAAVAQIAVLFIGSCVNLFKNVKEQIAEDWEND